MMTCVLGRAGLCELGRPGQSGVLAAWSTRPHGWDQSQPPAESLLSTPLVNRPRNRIWETLFGLVFLQRKQWDALGSAHHQPARE